MAAPGCRKDEKEKYNTRTRGRPGEREYGRPRMPSMDEQVEQVESMMPQAEVMTKENEESVDLAMEEHPDASRRVLKRRMRAGRPTDEQVFQEVTQVVQAEAKRSKRDQKERLKLGKDMNKQIQNKTAAKKSHTGSGHNQTRGKLRSTRGSRTQTTQ